MRRKPQKLRYFNTTDLEGKELQESITKALRQDAKVLEFFKKNPQEKLTKYEVLDKLKQANIIDERTPETSIGRALNTLMNEGYILKLNEFKIAKYGKRNHLWRLNES